MADSPAPPSDSAAPSNSTGRKVPRPPPRRPEPGEGSSGSVQSCDGEVPLRFGARAAAPKNNIRRVLNRLARAKRGLYKMADAVYGVSGGGPRALGRPPCNSPERSAGSTPHNTPGASSLFNKQLAAALKRNKLLEGQLKSAEMLLYSMEGEVVSLDNALDQAQEALRQAQQQNELLAGERLALLEMLHVTEPTPDAQRAARRLSYDREHRGEDDLRTSLDSHASFDAQAGVSKKPGVSSPSDAKRQKHHHEWHSYSAAWRWRLAVDLVVHAQDGSKAAATPPRAMAAAAFCAPSGSQMVVAP